MVLALLAAIVSLAFLVEAAAGFGGTVVTVSLASQLLPVDDVLARFLPVNVVLSAYVVLRYRRHVARRLLFARILPWMGLGAVAGFFLARAASPVWLKIVFATFVIVLSTLELWSLARRRPRTCALRAPIAAAALLVAGVLHGLFACGGPLAVWVVGREVDDKAVFRATLSALWLALNILLVAALTVDAKIQRRHPARERAAASGAGRRHRPRRASPRTPVARALPRRGLRSSPRLGRDPPRTFAARLAVRSAGHLNRMQRPPVNAAFASGRWMRSTLSPLISVTLRSERALP